MRPPLLGCLWSWPLLGASGAAVAQPNDYPDILVTAPVFHVSPERSLDSADVESYGLGTVGEIIAEIAAENGESRDDPAYLVNGKRVAGLGDVDDLPAEAIVRIDVMPAGSGLAVGASPRQRIYNIQLRRNLDLATTRVASRAATGGGWSSARGDIGFTHIRAERRLSLVAKARDDDMLLETERGVIQPLGSAPDAGRLRSLLPASDRIDLSLSAADQLASWLSGSLSSKLSIAQRRSLLGPFVRAAVVEGRLDQIARTLAASSDLTLNAQVGPWQIGLFGNYVYQRGRNLTDRTITGVATPVAARARSRTESIGGEVSAFGPVANLPAGPATLNVRAGMSRDTIAGERQLGDVTSVHQRTLTSSNLSGALDIPITSRTTGVLGFIGDLSASAEYSFQHASDFGSFQNYTLSLLWRPIDWLSLTASLGRSDSAPPISSLEEPPLETPGVRYFDPLRGETVDVIRITGGTADLRRQRDETRRLGASIKPVRSLGLRITAEYLDTRNLNLVSDLPVASLSILEVFPDRFIRDGDGRLIAVDARPVLFAGRRERQIRTGFNLTVPLGSPQKVIGALADDDEDDKESAPPSPRRGIRPRLQANLAHSWLIESKLAIRPGQAAIDLLSRDAVGFGGLGRPRHRLDASLGYAERGLGVRATAQWRGTSLIEASGSAANVLRFEALSTVSLRAWIQGERLAPGSGWLKGTRFTVSLINLADARERVVDRFGITPLSYQAAYRDPIGRNIEIELRKKF
jgi:hypothetical protein